MLTPQQFKAMQAIKRRPTGHFLLEGYAGTGKTYLLQHLLAADARAHRTVGAVAPTNKAVKVLKEMGRAAGIANSIRYQTVHQLLSLKPVIEQETGRQIFVPDQKNETSISAFRRLYIDEASMVPTDLYELIEQHTPKRSRVVWSGDPAQLPPVGEQASRAFDIDPRYCLTDVQRHGGQIQEFATRLRENLFSDRLPPIEVCDESDVWVCDKTMWMERLISEFRSAPNDVRAVAWTNRVVDWGNRRIHRAIYGDDASPYEVGQTLVARDVILQDDEIVLPNSEEGRIISACLGEHRDLPAWKIDLQPDDAPWPIRGLWVLDPSSVSAFQARLEILRRAAWEQRGRDRKHAWTDYYQYLRSFAALDYVYWSTVHKSQGSTYRKCFVALADILRNPDTYERNRCLYTAVTRASKQLVIARG